MIKSLILTLCLIFSSSIIFAEDVRLRLQQKNNGKASSDLSAEALPSLGSRRAKTDGLIAIVNNEIITKKDLDDFINFMRIQMSAQFPEQEVQERLKQILPDLVNRLIEDRLILQAAYKENIIINQIQIETRVEQIKRSYSSEADFQNALMSQGLSLADLELKIKEQLLMKEIIDKKIRAKIVVKPQEITDYYFAHSQDFQKLEQRRVSFLKISDSSMAEELEKTITEYKDLDTLAKKYSLPITDLGWVDSKQIKKEIVEIVFNLEERKLTFYSDSSNEFYIFEVKEIQPSGKLLLSEVQEEIRQFLFESKMQQALVEWLENLKSEAYIKIEDNYEPS